MSEDTQRMKNFLGNKKWRQSQYLSKNNNVNYIQHYGVEKNTKRLYGRSIKLYRAKQLV